MQQHWLNFTGFGVDDFASEEGRAMSIFCWLEKTFKVDDANIMLPNIHIISRMINGKYNALKGMIQRLSIERDKVKFINRKQESMASSSNIITQSYHFSTQGTTMPCWYNESARRCFLMGDSGIFWFRYALTATATCSH